MSPRAPRAGTEAPNASSRLASFRTTSGASGPAVASGGSLPLLCPECGAVEPAAGIGSRSGEIVVLGHHHFADERGHLYCRACFVVWRALPVQRLKAFAALDAVRSPEDPYTQLGAAPAWVGYGPSRFGALAVVQRNVNTSYEFTARESAGGRGRWENSALQRAGDRLRDAGAVCSAMGLPHHIVVDVEYHLTVLSQRAALRDLANSAREEAFVLATIALVCERRNVSLDLDALLETIEFRHVGAIPFNEFTRARDALRVWYARNVWRIPVPTKEER